MKTMTVRGMTFRTLLCAAACLVNSAAMAQEQMDLDAAFSVDPYPAPPETPSQVLIENATLWTIEADGILEGADILLENGKIAAIGSDITAGADALIIDAEGKHVTPGLVDAHSHSAVERFGVNEGVPSVSSEVRIEDVLDPDSHQIYSQLAGGLTTALILHGSANAIGGQNVVAKWRWGVESPEDLLFAEAPPSIKFALGENPKQSSQQSFGNTDSRYPKTRMGVAAIIRSTFHEAANYDAEWKRYDDLWALQRRREVPPRRDLRLEAVAQVLNGERIIHAHSYRADEIVMLIRLAEEFGIQVGTFQHVLEGYQVADEMAAHGAAGSTFSDFWSYKNEAFEAIPYNAALMAERGVLTSVNSDDANRARRMNLEAAMTVRSGGGDRELAMAMITINPARQLGVDAYVGSLAVGKDADVTIWSGDPLSVYSMAEMTFVDGALRFSREWDAAHRAKVEQARARLLAEINGTEDEPAETQESEADDTGEDVASSEPEDAAATPVTPATYRYARSQNDEPIAIVGATVHPISGPAIEDGVVIFDKGKIVAVGARDVAIPPSAEQVDAQGKHLWPGMIHANTVLGILEIDSVAGTVDVAETGDVNADVDVSLALDATSAHFPVARSGGITHAIVVPSGGIISGTTALVRTDGWTGEELAAVPRHSFVIGKKSGLPAFLQAILGGSKTVAERKEEFDERIDELDDALDAAEAYGKAWDVARDGERRPDYDAQLDALQPLLKGELPLLVVTQEKFEIEAIVKWAEERGLRIVLSGVRDAYLLIDFLAEHRVPLILTELGSQRPRPDDPYDTHYTLPAKLEEAGIPFAIASSVSLGGSSSARSLTMWAGIAAAYGLDREVAYRAVTLSPAEILGIDGELGSIEPGKSASLVLTDGDLLEQTTIVEQVWIDGNKSSMDDIQKIAYRKWGDRPLPAVAAQ